MGRKKLLLPTSSLLLEKKNLLAFSAGVDSSALLFLLLEHHIPFDIALVNYGTRESSDLEEAHAKKLAEKYGFKCYTVKAPQFDSRFEEQARGFRYAFFEELIREEGYETLLTAHQLNDQLEWLFMRLAKGAGLSELLGLEAVTPKANYQIMRPLLEVSKAELLEYLESHGYPYFIDESNEEVKYERNYFRKHFSDPLIAEYKEGIRRSIRYLKADQKRLESQFEVICREKQLHLIRLYASAAKVQAADTILKKMGYLMSAAQREELVRSESLVIGGKWAVEEQNDLLYIAPYSTVDMPKAFKEQCRVAKIPAKIRAYLFEAEIDPASILSHCHGSE
ncbi:tRNA lysidine(34) synthetase TilS [Sulfurovum sp.]|jgi:tRNA(Ile)-lysidine synthase|uniref:tRNA lysidine(34) synthetase TilS n=1 Tax=Sulfurovum sp. TaxID=1969726 RepID=UPI002A35FF59|nr:tRNA lysidine(34) synthetase TilS [Sulfurovum sp.]MDD2450538.1 tRNA lysidine(34) synthetase TilS [Sulfurovum sp.]MDD3500373.1 tRNA lysidine(34) synthetase TilS [Sulfurovum sp.]MDY0403918.1 tRNA lysidine(34) synthetase TilS [Sulfurovum sp.]